MDSDFLGSNHIVFEGSSDFAGDFVLGLVAPAKLQLDFLTTYQPT